MRIVGILAAATLSLASLHARADTAKAWSAARAGLPANARFVVGLDFAAVSKTQLFTALWPKLLEKADAGKVLEAMKTQCKIDPLVAVQGFVVGMADDEQEGAIYVALSGLDKAKLSSCLQRTIQDAAGKDTRVAVKQDGNITQVTDGKESMFLGWVSKDVVVVPLNTKDRASLVKWMSGKGALARTAVGKTIAKVNTSAAMWGAGEGSKDFEPGVTVKGAYGALVFSKGNLEANLHTTVETPAQAQAMATSLQKQLDDARQTPILPPAIAGMLKAVTIAAANDEVVLKANVIEKDLVSALSLVLGML